MHLPNYLMVFKMSAFNEVCKEGNWQDCLVILSKRSDNQMIPQIKCKVMACVASSTHEGTANHSLVLRNALHLNRGCKATCDLRAPDKDAKNDKTGRASQGNLAAEIDFTWEKIHSRLGNIIKQACEVNLVGWTRRNYILRQSMHKWDIYKR